MTISREIRLKSRPVGTPTADNFELATVTLPEPGPGEVQVRNSWMTVDPYMRGRMNDVQSYTPPFQIGEALQGGAVGEVVASNDPAFTAGELVQSFFGWREAFNAPAAAVQKLDTHGLPPQAFLGVAGMPGLTAYVGLLQIAALKDGDVVFVSGAAGAVGQIVCQIAKLKGHTVIGSAGGADKIAYLKEIGVDHVIDYKAETRPDRGPDARGARRHRRLFRQCRRRPPGSGADGRQAVRALRPLRHDLAVQRHRPGPGRARPDHGGRQAAAAGGLHRLQPLRHAAGVRAPTWPAGSPRARSSGARRWRRGSKTPRPPS